MNEKREIKTYKSIDEMVEYLYKSKKIIVDDEDKHYFSERNYISLINPYKQFFSTGRNNRHLRYLFPFLDIFKCFPSWSPD